MKKISFNIDKITEEPNPNGARKLRIRLRCDREYYTFGVKRSDYLNDASRESIHALWIKNIKERKEEKVDNAEKDAKRVEKVKKDKQKLKALLGNAVEEEE